MAKAATVVLSNRQRAILEQWCRNKADTSARLVERCTIILLSAEGVSNEEQGRRLGVDRQRIRRWRTRWSKSGERLAAAEQEEVTDKDLAKLLREVLADASRPGGPSTFTAEQLTQFIAVACEHPQESGRPVTHWTPRELTDEVIKRGVVETISPRHMGRLLREGALRPHRTQYWLTSKDKLENPEQYEADVRTVCQTYADAPRLAAEGGHVISTDEKTGIQALERIHATKQMKPGLNERIEFEYKRHGTLCLIANFDVVTGRSLVPSIGPTRTEEDFATHIAQTIDTDPNGTWVFVLDQLNTHKSESLARNCRAGYSSDRVSYQSAS